MKKSNKKELSPEQAKELLNTLKIRFEKNINTNQKDIRKNTSQGRKIKVKSIKKKMTQIRIIYCKVKK